MEDVNKELLDDSVYFVHSPNMKYGCKSLDDLLGYFSIEEIGVLEGLGFNVIEYDVYGLVIPGNGQLLYDSKKSKVSRQLKITRHGVYDIERCGYELRPYRSTLKMKIPTMVGDYILISKT